MDPILAFVGTAEVVTNKTAPQNTVPWLLAPPFPIYPFNYKEALLMRIQNVNFIDESPLSAVHGHILNTVVTRPRPSIVLREHLTQALAPKIRSYVYLKLEGMLDSTINVCQSSVWDTVSGNFVW